MRANLSEPMSTFEAGEKHMCPECAGGGDCDRDCVLSATCSLRCPHCGERNWFTGDLPLERPWKFNCRACNKACEVEGRRSFL